MAQQTAVEWIVEQLAKKHNEFQALTFYYDHKDEIAQARAMEKEQIVEAHNEGIWIEGKAFDEGEQYYKETYNK